MGFVLLTISFTVAILLASVIATVISFKLLGNDRFMKWFAGYYMKMAKKYMKTFEEEFEDWDV